ncbi:MAG: alpha-L-fucosidase [Planctomycetes bacterium]|nr:alpha-L-fucosidase [Planctomycetota bacterium]
MPLSHLSRRRFLTGAAAGAALAASAPASLAARAAAPAPPAPASPAAPAAAPPPGEADERGAQRLTLEALRRWESLGYGMFIHFGLNTFVGKDIPRTDPPAAAYAPDRLDVDQWVSVARDAGMKYAVLTAKHTTGHCLWPSDHTDYTVANSPVKTDVVGAFVKACRRAGLLPGLYYCSWDDHHMFGGQTPAVVKWSPIMNRFPKPGEALAPFTSSLYQSFQTAQLEELIARYGPLAEIWIDIPGVLGRGYRTFLYQHLAGLQPEAVIMMNSGIGSGEKYDVAYAWPSDLIAIERRMPPETGHRTWRTIEGQRYYVPGEVCDPISRYWFGMEGDAARPVDALAEQVTACRQRGVNVLLNVPPDKHGRIPDGHVQALAQLRKRLNL